MDAEEAEETTLFADVGAIAWYLRAVPWAVPGFSVEAHRQHLARLDERLRVEGPLSVRQPAFWFHAVKDGGPSLSAPSDASSRQESA